jgi:hypothetical protein
MPTVVDQLWSYVKGAPWLSPSELLNRVGAAASADAEDLDYRSRLLIHDSLDALAQHYGRRYVESRISRMPAADILRHAWNTQFDDDTGFPSLKHRIMEPTSVDDVMGYLRDLSARVNEPTSIIVGGSIALIMRDLLIRHTEDLDVVNDVPRTIRENHSLLEELHQQYDLKLGHFASHYLPDGWENRTASLGRFRQLDVRLVDPIDVLVGKLFSLRAKDLKDLRATWRAIDQTAFRERLIRNTRGLRTVGYLQEPAKKNWYILTGEEELPPLQQP